MLEGKEEFSHLLLLDLPSALKNIWQGQSKLLGKAARPLSFANPCKLTLEHRLEESSTHFWVNS
jgi:hypothetical protein